MSFYRGPHKALFVRLDTALSKRPRIFGSEYLFGRSLGAKLYTNNTQCYMLSFFRFFFAFLISGRIHSVGYKGGYKGTM